MSAKRYALCIVVFFLPLAPADTLAADVGDTAPDFHLRSIQSPQQTVDLASNRGRLLYLDFWSAWCKPCREKMPLLADLDQRYADFNVIGINVDRLITDPRPYLEQSAPGYPTAFDPGAKTAARYGVATLPAGFLIDADGIIRSVHRGTGVWDPAELESHIKALTGTPAMRAEEIP